MEINWTPIIWEVCIAWAVASMLLVLFACARSSQNSRLDEPIERWLSRERGE